MQPPGSVAAVSHFSGAGNLLSDIDFKSNQIKDFSKAYKLLATKLIEKGAAADTQSHLLITDKDVTKYKRQ